MSEVHVVLIVPAESDPHGLLREGPCGARPPIVHEAHKQSAFGPNTTVWTTSEATVYTSKKQAPYMPHRRALALAWEGKPVPEGLDRLGRAPAVTREWVSHVVGVALGWWPGDVDVLTDHQLPGALVLLDAEGREVKDERA